MPGDSGADGYPASVAAAAMASGLVSVASNVTDARPRANDTFADRTPDTPFIARSTWATQLAQSMPLTEKSAVVGEGSGRVAVMAKHSTLQSLAFGRSAGARRSATPRSAAPGVR
jgi:hypothetical protein